LRRTAGRSWMLVAESSEMARNWRGLCPAVDCSRLMMMIMSSKNSCTEYYVMPNYIMPKRNVFNCLHIKFPCDPIQWRRILVSHPTWVPLYQLLLLATIYPKLFSVIMSTVELERSVSRLYVGISMEFALCFSHKLF
jgi:hypothetical protein